MCRNAFGSFNKRSANAYCTQNLLNFQEKIRSNWRYGRVKLIHLANEWADLSLIGMFA
jgi:hypothetical protein